MLFYYSTMRLFSTILAAVFLVFFFPECSLSNVTDQQDVETTLKIQETAVRGLITRTIGEDASKSFTVKVDKTMPPRSFQITKPSHSTISIIGSDGVSVAKGFHHYLKYYLHKYIDWTHTQVELPLSIQLPNVTFFSISASDFIYYQNVCTWSYSFAWWTFSNWRRHIDWMAMMGVTLTIAPIQEYIWYDIYSNMGLTKNEIDDHFAGPAFQAWQRMGNIRGWGGPIPQSYRRMQKVLQQRILKAQRDLGMRVALPAFAGHVPVAMARLFPNATFTPIERWNRFPNKYCCGLFLDPSEPLYHQIATEFLNLTIKIYGSDNIYFCDPFNEIQPRLANAEYLNATAYHIYQSMSLVDASAVWLLQGWMFVKNIFWTDELIKAFLLAVPRGKMLVLDLQSEQFPQYERTHSFHGQPFIWCMLHNFGGTLGMHGSVDIVNTRIRLARNMANSSMIGVGITPEGIHQNYAMYSLALERGWLQDDIDLKLWFDSYADVRYGVSDARLHKVWQLLRYSVYSYEGLLKIRGKYCIARRPSTNLSPWIWYNASSVYDAWEQLLHVERNTTVPQYNLPFFLHDLVDLTRQFLQITFDRLYVNLMDAYKNKQFDRFINISDKLLEILNDLERILATSMDFSLGQWLEAAKNLGRRPVEKQLYEMNARNQITAWGPDGQILDYATKQWSGVVTDYYLPRWALFLQMLQTSLKQNEKFNEEAFKRTVSREIENPFSISSKVYPLEPVGDSITVSQQIFHKWTAYMKDTLFIDHSSDSVRAIQASVFVEPHSN
ncbi:alpha-N-acetylglucosaminidase [Anastrepha obliqua]|uniref:alpha-N-acetylglucosaminidase n=1 Tax=Anastrepha obliqua TaxID=95512 RepID=UPI0024096590|nr:alpha-N-acetylglucosaminidase [Anastrepha obliqua]